MKTRLSSAPALLGTLTLIVACEASTSGADFVASDGDAGSSAEAGVEAGPGLGPDGGPTSDATTDDDDDTIGACPACAATKCSAELTECGGTCLEALACAEACDDAVCRERCLRDADSVELSTFKTCFFTKCTSECTEVQALFTGILTYAKVHCAGLAVCAPGALAFDYGDTAGCEVALGNYYLLSATRPGSGVSLTTLSGCAARETSLTCDELISSRGAFACQIQGRKTLGEPCEEDSQCESAFCPGPNRQCATCQPAPAFGEPCAAEDRCAPGLVCNTSAGKCAFSALRGQSCQTSADATSICEIGNCIGGVCEGPRGVGADCDRALGPFCSYARGATCHPTLGRCVPWNFLKPGSPCGGPTEGEVNSCQSLAACTSGKCSAPPAIGEDCDLETGPYCPPPLACKDGKCIGFEIPYSCE